MSDSILLKNGRIIDPSQGRDQVADLLLIDGVIAEEGHPVEEISQVFDVKGCWVVPGLIDLHVHLREPGEEYKETILTGTRAAAAGGYTAVACMPNTRPINDNESITKFILKQATQASARVYPVGALSHQQKGERLADYGEMLEAGAVAFTDDGLPVSDSRLMRRALEYAKSHQALIMSHAEDLALSRGGCMHEGEVSTLLGLKGIPAAAEAVMVYRDIALAEMTGARLHVCHVSCEQSTALIRSAKARGVRVTAETAPHYFSLTDQAVMGYDTRAKMSPPLRTAADQQAIVEALADGTLDAIATDHAPHTILEKELEFQFAANGIIGLETALPLALALVRRGALTPSRLVELMSCSPAKILGVRGGTLRSGGVADVAVIDPAASFVYNRAKGYSKGENSPFEGHEMQGRAVLTILGGRLVHSLLG